MSKKKKKRRKKKAKIARGEINLRWCFLYEYSIKSPFIGFCSSIQVFLLKSSPLLACWCSNLKDLSFLENLNCAQEPRMCFSLPVSPWFFQHGLGGIAQLTKLQCPHLPLSLEWLCLLPRLNRFWIQRMYLRITPEHQLHGPHLSDLIHIQTLRTLTKRTQSKVLNTKFCSL